jgi:hypothetical protein
MRPSILYAVGIPTGNPDEPYGMIDGPHPDMGAMLARNRRTDQDEIHLLRLVRNGVVPLMALARDGAWQPTGKPLMQAEQAIVDGRKAWERVDPLDAEAAAMLDQLGILRARQVATGGKGSELLQRVANLIEALLDHRAELRRQLEERAGDRCAPTLRHL